MGFNQIQVQPNIYPSILEWQNIGEETGDHLPIDSPYFAEWIKQNTIRKIIVSSPIESSDMPYIDQNEYEYIFDELGRIIKMMSFEVIQYRSIFTPEFKKNIPKLALFIDSNNMYNLPKGFLMYTNERQKIKHIIKTNELGDTVYQVYGDESISRHAIYSRILIKEIRWNYKENEIITFSHGLKESGLSGEFGNIYDISSIEVRNYENDYLTGIKLINKPDRFFYYDYSPFREGQDTVFFKSNQYQIIGSKEQISEFYRKDGKYLEETFKEDLFKFLKLINPTDSFEFEVLELFVSFQSFHESNIRFKVKNDNKEFYFLMNTSTSSLRGTSIERMDDNTLLVQSFMISGDQQKIIQMQKYSADGRILFEENIRGKRVNYHYLETGELVGESVLQRCRTNDNYSSKKRDLKKNYCAKGNDLRTIDQPYTQIEQFFEVMRKEGWTYSFIK